MICPAAAASTGDGEARLIPGLRIDQAPGRVTFALSVRNDGGQPATLRFRTSQQIEVVVENDAGRVWTYSEGRFFLQALAEVTVPAGGRWVSPEAVWEDPPQGAYTARAYPPAGNRGRSLEVQKAFTFHG